MLLKNKEFKHTYAYRRTALKVLKYIAKNHFISYNVVGIGFPKNREDLRPFWKKAVKRALRLLKRLYTIEYICLFEVSHRGHEHFHIILMRRQQGTDKNSAAFVRLDAMELKEFRRLVFMTLLQLKKDKSRYSYTKVTLDKLSAELNLDKLGFVYSVKGKNTKHGFLHPGKGPAFFDYMIQKPHLTRQGVTTVSSGLLSLKMRKIKRLQPRGWNVKVTKHQSMWEI